MYYGDHPSLRKTIRKRDTPRLVWDATTDVPRLVGRAENGVSPQLAGRRQYVSCAHACPGTPRSTLLRIHANAQAHVQACKKGIRNMCAITCMILMPCMIHMPVFNHSKILHLAQGGESHSTSLLPPPPPACQLGGGGGTPPPTHWLHLPLPQLKASQHTSSLYPR